MAINYAPVGWDTTKYINPTNMNHMDEGIKAACDKADANEAAIADVNSNLFQFKIVSGIVDSDGIATINYPDGYTVDNCILISAEIIIESQHYTLYPSFNLFFYVGTHADAIRVNSTTDYTGKTVNVVLMKVK